MSASRLIVVCLYLAGTAAAQQGLFQALDNSLPAGIEAIGDLDGDGDADLVMYGAVLLNDGHGRFSSVAVPSLAAPRYRTHLADLNGDGLLDLIAAPSFTGGIQTWLNVGGLVFTLSQTLPVGPPGTNPNASLWEYATGDVDGDGDVDLLVGVTDTWTAALLPPQLWLNGGAGSMAMAPAGAVPAVPLPSWQILLRDLDGDGDSDAVFRAHAGLSIHFLAQIWIATNVGGTFVLSPTPLLTGACWALEIGNFNNDALPDLVVSMGFASTQVFLNSPGGFLPPVTSPRPFWVLGYAPMDLNGDGIDELLESSSPYPPTVMVTSVGAGGVLGAAAQTWTDLSVAGVADLDGDGDRDALAVRNASMPYGFEHSSETVTLMNAGFGLLTRIGGRVTDLAYKSSQHAGDLDQDGDVDLIGAPRAGPIVAAVGLNDGQGFFTAGPITPIAANGSNYRAHLFDRDGDGDMDLYAVLDLNGVLVPTPNPHLVYDNVGGVFNLAATVPSAGDERGFQSADFDGDGDADVVMGHWIIGTPAGPMTYLANIGPAGFAPPASIGTTHNNYDLDLGDFDGNGTIDVFQTNNRQYPYPSLPPDPSVVYLNSGAGVFTPVTVDGAMGRFAVAGDLNQDGKDDVVIDGQTWIATVGGRFVPGPPLASGLIGPASLADVDLDGDLDLVERPATVMFNGGGGTFGAPVSYRPRVGTTHYAYEIPESSVVDVDQDGDLDLIVPGPLVLVNTTRQIAHGSVPRPGRPGSVDLFGTPDGAWWLFASNGTTSFAYPPWGNVMIDPASAQLVASGMFTGPAAASPGTASFGITFPNNPALVGFTTYLQAIDGRQMRLTNSLTITVRGY